MRIDILTALGLIQLLLDRVKAAMGNGEPIEVGDIGTELAAVDARVQAARAPDPNPEP